MIKARLGFLSNHLHCHLFNLIPCTELYEQVRIAFPDCYADYKYCVCLVETETNAVLEIYALTNYKDYFKTSFNFYLAQLPDLNLHSVALLFALVSGAASRLLDAPFQLRNDYPSEFAKAYLKDTFGQVIYTYQFMALLSFCLPGDENNTNQINEYRRLYNLRQVKFFKKLEELYLPDGYSLFKLLESYTPYGTKDNGFGFVRKPTHEQAFRFIEIARKYIVS